MTHPNRSQEKKLRLSSEAGMTLIEIVIVLTIVAGMAAMLYQGVFKNKDKAMVQQTKIAMGKVTQALQLYNVDCNKFPSSLDGLIENSGGECKNWGPDSYLDKYPKDSFGKELEYESDGSTFVIRSLGKDGKPGGSGLNADISSEDLEK